MARISKRLRFEILRRDNHQCRYCGAGAPDTELRVDHVVPEALGGRTEPGNLVTACEPCNSGKSSMAPDAPIVDDVQQDALRWARAMQIAAAGQRSERAERDRYRQDFHILWNDWGYEYQGKRQTMPLPPDWAGSVDAFIRAGLDMDDLADAINTAMSKTHIRLETLFRYFCGICWRMLDDRRETASTLVHLVSDDEETQG